MTDSARHRFGLRAVLLALLLFGGMSTASPPAFAGDDVAQAAAIGNAGIGACAGSAGKAVYDCVANVLDGMASRIARNHPEAARSLQAAAAGVRSAVKAQALSAIAQCRTALAGAMAQARKLAGGFLDGWGGAGLGAIQGVLARAAQLIQSKG